MLDLVLLELSSNTRHYFQINLDEAITSEGKRSEQAVFVGAIAQQPVPLITEIICALVAVVSR